MITVSRVTRNSDNADVLRSACAAAISEGRSVEIIEEYTAGDWWTTFKIEWPSSYLVDMRGDPAPLDLDSALRKHKK